MDNNTHDDIFAMLETIENDAEDDIDELMNDSGTEFVAEEYVFGGTYRYRLFHYHA